MASQGNHGPAGPGKPSWGDVAAMIGWLEATYGGHVEITMDVEGVGGRVGAMWVYAKLWVDWAPATNRPQHIARQLWPTYGAKEMPALCFRLLHSLDHMADAERRAGSEELPF